MNFVFKFVVLFHVIQLYNVVTANPCEIASSVNSARIEFNENTPINSVLFKLPFVGVETDIEQIKLESNELNEHELNTYFKLKNYKNFLLNKHYDLEKTELDFIEILFTCESKLINNKFKFSNTFLLYVTINDVNDKKPEFLFVPYRFSLKELTPIGSIVYSSIKAIDRDMANRPNSQISFSIQKGAYSEYFEFPLTTKPELAVTKLIHYNSFSKCNLTIIATDHGVPQLSTETTIEIDIIDIDDKDPIFTRNFYNGFIARNGFIASVVNMSEEIRAYDQDTGINAEIEYSLTNNPENLFEIDKKSGIVSLKNLIVDYDVYEYSLIVKASQIDNELRTAISMINIQIIDINVYSPKFESSIYEVSIEENSKLETTVCQVKATDMDKNRIEYSILNNYESPFIIDKYKGIIKVNGRLDYEMKSKYFIEVLAFDGNYTDKTLVKIKLINLIDKAPSFEYNFYNFKIKIPYDVYIGQIKANDMENTGNMSYSIKFSNVNDSSLFCITQTGTIYICPSIMSPSKHLNDLIDLFKHDEYKFNVSVGIYSKDLASYLENSVECKIQIESKKIIEIKNESSSSSSVLHIYDKNVDNSLEAFKPNMFIKNHFIKDITGLNIIILIILIVLILLIFMLALLVWFKCKSFNKHKNYTKNLSFYNNNNNHKNVNTTSTSLDNAITSSSGISCSSSSASESNYIKDNSPISKITILSDYLSNNQDTTNKLSNPIRVSCYSDLLSSAASTLKNRETPILIKPDYFESSPTTHQLNIPILIEQQNKNEDYTTTNYTSLLEASDTSPKLLTFLPPHPNSKEEVNCYLNLMFNQHEPLSANSELNLENSEIIKISDKYEDVKNLKFQTSLNNCNESLAKLVNIINENVNQNDSLISVSVDTGLESHDPETYDEFVYDDNLTSTNVDQDTSSSFLSNLTPLTNVSCSLRSSTRSDHLSDKSLKINMNRDVYKICFSNDDKNLSFVSTSASSDSRDFVELNKIYYNLSKNETSAYV